MKPFDWRSHLEPGEVLLWQGRPYPALGLIRPRQVEILIGALGAVAVAALIIADRALAAPSEGSSRPILFLGLLLIALLVTGIPFRAMRQRSLALKRIAYAVTDRRVLTGNAKTRALTAAATLPPSARPSLRPEPHGLATLHFTPGAPEFPHLKDAEAVLRLIDTVRGE